MDPSGKIPLALRDRYFRYPSNCHNSGAPTRVSSSSFSFLLALSSPLLIGFTLLHRFVACLQLPPSGRKDSLAWECNNGGQLWPANLAAVGPTTTTIPSIFCTTAFASINVAFIIALVVDLFCQVHMIFYASWFFLMHDVIDIHVFFNLAIRNTAGELRRHEGTVLRRRVFSFPC